MQLFNHFLLYRGTAEENRIYADFSFVYYVCLCCSQISFLSSAHNFYSAQLTKLLEMHFKRPRHLQ